MSENLQLTTDNQEQPKTTPEPTTPLPTEYTIGEQTYSIEDLQGFIEAANHARVIDQLMSSPEGMDQLEYVLSEHRSKSGWNKPAPTPSAPSFELPEAATQNETALMEAMKFLYEAMNTKEADTRKAVDDLKGVWNRESQQIKFERSSAKAVQLVKEQLNLDMAPAKVIEAQLKTGIEDPVKAVMAHFPEEAIKALKSNPSPKPNHLDTEVTKPVDPESMSATERYLWAKNNPELVEQWAKEKGLSPS